MIVSAASCASLSAACARQRENEYAPLRKIFRKLHGVAGGMEYCAIDLSPRPGYQGRPCTR